MGSWLVERTAVAVGVAPEIAARRTRASSTSSCRTSARTPTTRPSGRWCRRRRARRSRPATRSATSMRCTSTGRTSSRRSPVSNASRTSFSTACDTTPDPTGGRSRPRMVDSGDAIARRDRRGRSHHPHGPARDPRGRGLRGGRRDRPRRPGGRARPGAAARSRHPRHQDAGHGRCRGGPHHQRREDLRRADADRVQPARGGRGSPRRRRAGVPRQTVPEERPDPGDRGGDGSLPRTAHAHRRDRRPRRAARGAQVHRTGQGRADGRVRR